MGELDALEDDLAMETAGGGSVPAYLQVRGSCCSACSLHPRISHARRCMPHLPGAAALCRSRLPPSWIRSLARAAPMNLSRYRQRQCPGFDMLLAHSTAVMNRVSAGRGLTGGASGGAGAGAGAASGRVWAAGHPAADMTKGPTPFPLPRRPASLCPVLCEPCCAPLVSLLQPLLLPCTCLRLSQTAASHCRLSTACRPSSLISPLSTAASAPL